MPGRQIVFSKKCDTAAKALGGYQCIDISLDAAWDALNLNPYGFPLIENDWFSARIIVTKPVGNLSALVWVFVIEEGGSVLIDHVEEYDAY